MPQLSVQGDAVLQRGLLVAVHSEDLLENLAFQPAEAFEDPEAQVTIITPLSDD